jgi:hypothetical protein
MDVGQRAKSQAWIRAAMPAAFITSNIDCRPGPFAPSVPRPTLTPAVR